MAAYDELSQVQVGDLMQSPEKRETLGNLFTELATQTGNLVRDEVALAKQELREKLGTFQSAVITLALGSSIALMSALTLCAAVVLALAEYVKPWQSALIVGLALAVAAGIFLLIGITRFKRADLRPEQTLETLEENKEWLKELT